MLTMNDDLEGALKMYLQCLDKGAYFEAHEVLEEAWHPLRLRQDVLANLVKGLINGAICFEHMKRNKKKAKSRAERVIVSYERHKHLCKQDIENYTLFKSAIAKIENLKKRYKINYDDM